MVPKPDRLPKVRVRKITADQVRVVDEDGSVGVAKTWPIAVNSPA
jgi:hypothetical protein